MELRSLLQVIVHRWWLVIPIFLITLGAAVVLTLSQRPAWEATTRLEVVPSAGFGSEDVNALSLIARQSEITDTYAQIASSRRIQGEAADTLGLSRDQRLSASVSSRLVTGTTLIDITGRATGRANEGAGSLAMAYANEVALGLKEYVEASGVFDINIVDAATEPQRPVSPNIPLNIALGGVAGLLLGIGLAVVTYIINPPPRGALRDVIDPETWAFNEAFLVYRLRQELSRSRRARVPVALALININHLRALDDLLPRPRTEALRRIAALLDGHLRAEDVAARVSGTTFGIIFPDTSEEQAVAMVESLRARISMPALATLSGGGTVHANPAAGVVAYTGAGSDTELLEQARLALMTAETGPIGRTEAFSTLSPQRST